MNNIESLLIKPAGRRFVYYLSEETSRELFDPLQMCHTLSDLNEVIFSGSQSRAMILRRGVIDWRMRFAQGAEAERAAAPT